MVSSVYDVWDERSCSAGVSPWVSGTGLWL